MDDVYFDTPYYLVPDKAGADACVALREAMSRSKVAAIGAIGLIGEPLTLMYTPTAVFIGIVSVNLPYVVLTLQSVLEGLDPNTKMPRSASAPARSRPSDW